jgi:hypothetical protein
MGSFNLVFWDFFVEMNASFKMYAMLCMGSVRIFLGIFRIMVVVEYPSKISIEMLGAITKCISFHLKLNI